MSKSLGNFITLRDIIKEGYDPLIIRYLLISTHYRKPLKFSFESLKSAEQSLKRINDFIFSLKGIKASEGETNEISDLIKKNEAEFKENMNNDLNISGALGVFFDFIYKTNVKLYLLKQKDIKNILSYVDRINSIIGVLREKKSETLENRIKEKIELREKARKEKDFKLADEIRDELKSEGVVLIDTPDGVRWKKE